MENGTFVHRESQTYRRKVLANEWLRRREYEMDQERASCQAVHKKISVWEPLRDYVSAAENVTEWGRSKKADIARLQASGRADLQTTKLTVQDLMGYAKKRRTEDEAGPSTVLNDMVWLRQVFLHASAARGIDAPLHVLHRAKSELLRTWVIAKPAQRSHRLLPEEESKLLEHFASRDGRASIPMRDIMQFALLTARRQEEICRLRWVDVDFEKGVAWLDDVKHPRMKKGNRRCFRVLNAAADIIKSQSREEGVEFVFPYNNRSVGAAFTRACHVLGIEDLHFHDLRHEATSRLFEKGYSIQEVAQFTLRESWATLKRYRPHRPSR
ncbi:site-specific integrase [Delftia sp. HK171]|uniref:site-specific integrase n=1 Tax=Delftia sp. HK171 TaxID=1920191 RepID=UPI0009FB89DF|nr:site-specific integrase [Delftia sp. HK171]